VFLNCVCCNSQVTGCGGMYWNVQWLRIADSAAWNWVCASWTSHHSMCLLNLSPQYVPPEPLTRVCTSWPFHHSVKTVPFTEMSSFDGVLGSRKYLPNESLTNYIKIHSGIRCICKSVNSEYYLHHVCPLAINRLPLGVLSWIFFGTKSLEKM
jgi:hypothetical protein